MRRYTIIVEAPEEAGDNFSAYSPDVPGCVATGDTEEECVDAMADALELHLAGLAEDDAPPPLRRSSAVEVAVPSPPRWGKPRPRAAA